jgi:2-polyprenyl-6-methoxyphenol hydroxylase-like FAD-dependent oxidoreductase
MADYEDPTPWADEAHVFFTPRGSVESFPLPGGQRRFVLPGPAMAPGAAAAFLAAEVPSRSGVDLGGRDPSWTMTFGVRRYLARSYRAGRLLLAGDAAHLMSPIVGQNLNTGVADAELLSLCLERIIRCGESPARWFDFYERTRRRAAEAAAFRAWLMMRLGASGGRAWSAVRNRLARAALCTHVQRPLARLFSMVSIPGRNLSALAPTPAGPT